MDVPHQSPRSHISRGSGDRLIGPGSAALFLLVLLCCLFGGAGFSLSGPYLLFFFAISLCTATLIYGARARSGESLHRPFAVIVGIIWLFPLLQLVPLPPGIWTSLPGREIATTVRSALGEADSWRSFSISQPDTWISFLGVSVFAIAFFGALQVSDRQMRALLWLLCGIAFADIIVGSFQVATGGQLFDFHSSAHRATLIGFFSNRNHTALYLAAVMPLFTYMVFTAKGAVRPYRNYAIMSGLFVLFIGVVGTSSRAGLTLGVMALLASIAMISFRSRFLQSKKHFVIFALVAVAVVVPILVSERFTTVLQRFDSVSSDLRWTIWQQSWTVIQAYLPLGSGFGTFRTAYDPLEPLAMVSPQFVNNAHNDYLELLLEAGYPGVILFLVAIGTILVRAVRVSPRIFSAGLMSVYTPAILFVLFVLAHSTVDYPVRRLAIAVPLALMLAILFRAAPAGETADPSSRRRVSSRPRD